MLPKATADVPCSFLALYSFSLCFLNHKALQPTPRHQSCVWLQPELSESLGLGIFIHLLWKIRTDALQVCSDWQVWCGRRKMCNSPASPSRRQHPLFPYLQSAAHGVPSLSHCGHGDCREVGVDLSCSCTIIGVLSWQISANWWDDLQCLGGAGRACRCHSTFETGWTCTGNWYSSSLWTSDENQGLEIRHFCWNYIFAYMPFFLFSCFNGLEIS